MRIIRVLRDEFRSGSKSFFSVEQIVQIVAIACEDPGSSELPVTHWTPKELADEAVKRGIVEQIGFDFANHIASTIETDPDGGWIFIVDQLNTHKSASLVRLVAACCQLDIDLGIKEKSGILKSMETRATFLSDSTHRIRFVYVPKHTSWLNQIECWFSILMRRLRISGQLYLHR